MLPTGRQTRSSSKAQLAAAVAATSLNDDDDKKNPPPSAAAATSDPLSASTLALLQTDAVIASVSSFLSSTAGSPSVTSCYLDLYEPSGGSDLLKLRGLQGAAILWLEVGRSHPVLPQRSHVFRYQTTRCLFIRHAATARTSGGSHYPRCEGHAVSAFLTYALWLLPACGIPSIGATI